MAGDELESRATEDFGAFTTQIDSVASDFNGHLGAAGQHSGTATGTSAMAEGAAFLKADQGARQTLGQFMTTTHQGLKGYQKAVAAIGAEYDRQIVLSTAIMNRLLQPSTGPVTTDPRFVAPDQGGI